jgi:hypothetical protein
VREKNKRETKRTRNRRDRDREAERVLGYDTVLMDPPK